MGGLILTGRMKVLAVAALCLCLAYDEASSAEVSSERKVSPKRSKSWQEMRRLNSEITALEKESGWNKVKQRVQDGLFTKSVDIQEAIKLLEPPYDLLNAFPEQINAECKTQREICAEDDDCSEKWDQFMEGWKEVMETESKEACVECIGKLIGQVYLQYDKSNDAQVALVSCMEEQLNPILHPISNEEEDEDE